MLSHVTAVGPDLRECARHLGQRLGFAISLGEEENQLRVLMEQGYLELRSEESFQWHFSRFWLRPEVASRPEVLSELAARPQVLNEALARPDVPTDTALARILPDSLSADVPPRPQDAMEPERARAVVSHPNSAIGLAGVMVLVPELEPAVALYELTLGLTAGPVFADSTLGVEGRSFVLDSGQRISLVIASSGTGPAARVRRETASGICGVMIKVRSLDAARDALRHGAIYAFANEGNLVTSSPLPGYGILIFEETFSGDGP